MKSALLIERDASTRRSLEFSLALHGYLTTVAPSIARARDLAGQHAFDLVIAGQPVSDADSPADVCRAIRSTPELAHTPILMMEARGSQDASAEALRAGANGYLGSPVDDAQLRTRLSNLESVISVPESSPDVTITAASSAAGAPDRYRVLIEQVSGLMLIVETDGTIIWASPAAQRVLGRDPEGLAGTSVLRLCHVDDLSILSRLLASAVTTGTSEEMAVDLRFLREDGDTVDVELRVDNLQEDPAIRGVVLAGHDVSMRVQRERALRGRLLHDSLTGLPNRLLFADYARRMLARAERRNDPVVMAYIDLDDLHEVNLRHGRAAVDNLLREVAARLHRSLRANDTTSHFGDDEFVILLDDIASESDASVVADRLLDQFMRPFEITDVAGVTSIVVTGSIGVAVSPPGEAATHVEGESRLNDLLRRADAALSRAKATGKARWVHADDLSISNPVSPPVGP
jgi:diguanylate cyclase (GGDEF)-like protein/PAS domain S-box-containing protein